MLGHRVQGAPILEPLNLCLIVRMRELCLPRLTVLGVHSQSHRFADRDFRAHDINLVVRVDLVVVGRVGEGEREHALFFEVGFVLDRGIQLVC